MGRRPLGDLNPNNYNRALDVGGPAQISSSGGGGCCARRSRGEDAVGDLAEAGADKVGLGVDWIARHARPSDERCPATSGQRAATSQACAATSVTSPIG